MASAGALEPLDVRLHKIRDKQLADLKTIVDELLSDTLCRGESAKIDAVFDKSSMTIYRVKRMLDDIKLEIIDRVGEGDPLYYEDWKDIYEEFDKMSTAAKNWVAAQREQLQQIRKEVDPKPSRTGFGEKFYRHMSTADQLKLDVSHIVLPPIHLLLVPNMMELSAKLDEEINDMQQKITKNVDDLVDTKWPYKPHLKSLARANYKVVQDALDAKKMFSKNYKEWAICWAQHTQRGSPAPTYYSASQASVPVRSHPSSRQPSRAGTPARVVSPSGSQRSIASRNSGLRDRPQDRE